MALVNEIRRKQTIQPPDPQPLWTISECADYLAMSIHTLYRMSSLGVGPVPVKIGGRLRYEPELVRAYVVEQRKQGQR